jgi:hypothetical protein
MHGAVKIPVNARPGGMFISPKTQKRANEDELV